MINSKLANALVLLLGCLLVSIPLAATLTEQAASGGTLLFGVLGAWCIVGPIVNIRQRASRRVLPGYRFPKWNLLFFGVCVVAAVIAMIGIGKAQRPAPFETLLLMAGQGLVLAFLATCGVLLYHRITKGQRN